VQTEAGRIVALKVRRGAPCGATWDAAARVIGLPVDEAMVRIGLETQYCCAADPAGWDPIYGKSPVHFAGHIHQSALKKALTELPNTHEGRRCPS
jgi:thymidylate synthase